MDFHELLKDYHGYNITLIILITLRKRPFLIPYYKNY